MAKFVQILFVAFLMVALCAAEVTRSRTSRFQVKRNRFLARQEVEDEPAAVTPYPSANELKPEVPFDEAVAAEEQTPNQPDEVYGPPEQEVPVETDDIVPVEEEVPTEEEEAAAAEEQAIAEAEAAAEEEAAVEEEAAASSRLTERRGAFRKSFVRPAKLRKAAPAKLRKITPVRLQLQPQFVQQPLFYYVAQ